MTVRKEHQKEHGNADPGLLPIARRAGESDPEQRRARAEERRQDDDLGAGWRKVEVMRVGKQHRVKAEENRVQHSGLHARLASAHEVDDPFRIPHGHRPEDLEALTEAALEVFTRVVTEHVYPIGEKALHL